ncbi:UbiD family decarboxylase [Thermanaeromonas sp. C210]|uniref:UbiD family decarboxylase n=1 Tax=Thermanaeromonas sp. C210 TaxID=2731925 RepID=UPI00155CB588|nr:UbiD family decarboxylase [Thermanaeromonas sp. C210]GFN21793.1 hypothetical protein TAMC210_01090 [Thermanaeromonas sp. C210]
MDLRQYLDLLREKGHLVEISRKVSPRFELANVINTMLQEGGPIGLFTNVDHPSGMMVTGGLLAHPERVALALGCRVEEVNSRVEAATENLVEPVTVERPLFLENVFQGEEVDLTRQLPIPHHNPGDGGPYITAGIVISRDPVTGRQNYSYNRLHLKGPRRLAVMMNEWRHIAWFYREAEKRGEPLPIAVAIGMDPVVEIAAGFRIEDDEIKLAGALRGRPMELGKCATVDIYAPQEAEIVIEGRILPHHREEEGPLAEFTGHFGEVYQHPVVEVTALCHRHRPVYRTIVPGSFEHVYIGNVLPREPMLLRFARHVSPNVKGVHLLPCTGGFMAVISLDKQNQGEPKNVALAALMTHVNIKMALVVDTDVNIYDTGDLLWALATRVDAARDIFTVPYAQGMENDPTTGADGTHTKVGIDATLDLALRKDYRRVVYPRVNLKEYLPLGATGPISSAC